MTEIARNLSAIGLVLGPEAGAQPRLLSEWCQEVPSHAAETGGDGEGRPADDRQAKEIDARTHVLRIARMAVGPLPDERATQAQGGMEAGMRTVGRTTPTARAPRTVTRRQE